MPDTGLPVTGRGLTWVLSDGRDLVTKTLAPSFVFVDLETYVNTNACHRLQKRHISPYVSVNAPLLLLESVYGADAANELLCGDAGSAMVERTRDYVCEAFESACSAVASALVLCDDLLKLEQSNGGRDFVIEHIFPMYKVFADKAAELGLPLIYHASGDIRDYLQALAAVGFAGVHVSHPDPSLVIALFGSARAAGLRPLGGLVGSKVPEGPEALARIASELEAAGPALICDDGTIKDIEGLRTITSALALMS